MSYLKELQAIEDVSQLRSRVKELVSNESFLDEVLSQKEEFVPFLLSRKIGQPQIFQKFEETSDLLEFFVNQCIDNNFTPSTEMVDKLVTLGNDQLLLKVISSFPSIPFDFQLLMKLINAQNINSAVEVVKSKKELQKKEMFLLLLKNATSDPFIIEQSKASDWISEEVIKDLMNKDALKSYDESYVSWLVSEKIPLFLENMIEHQRKARENGYNYYISYDISKINSVLSIPGLSSQAYANILQLRADLFVNKRTRRGEQQYDLNTTIEWSPELESVEPIKLFKIKIKNVPSDSIHRMRGINGFPEEASEEEIIQYFSTSTTVSFQMARHVLDKPVSFIERLKIELIEEAMSPTEVLESIRGDLEKAKLLYNKLSSKYRPALRKIIPASEEVADKGRKRSYFIEAFQAIKDNDVHNFQAALSKGYSVEDFAEDSHQSSKQRGCEITSVSEEFIFQLRKEELLALCKTPLRLSFHDLLRYQLTVAEAILVHEKLNIDVCFDSCSDQVGFILSPLVSQEDVDSLFYSKKSEIIATPSLFKAYLKRSENGEGLTLSASSVRSLAEVLSSKEMAKFKIEDHGKADIVDVKCADGEFLISDAGVLDLLDNRYGIESHSFMDAIVKRDKSLALKIIDAYLLGNKELSKLAGKPVNIRRSKKDRFEALKTELSTNPIEIMNQIFENGADINDFKKSFVDWKKTLSTYPERKTVIVKRVSTSELADFQLIPLDFKVDVLELYLDEEHTIPKNVTVEEVHLRSYDVEESKIPLIKNFLTTNNIEKLTLTNNQDWDTGILLLKSGIDWNYKQDVLKEIATGDFYTFNFTVQKFKELEPFGMMMTRELVNQIIQNNHSDKEIMEWLISRVGRLDGHSIADFNIDEDDQEIRAFLLKHGVKILSEKEISTRQILEQLEEEGTLFSGLDLSGMSGKEKIEMIRYIEKNIDPRYKDLNLAATDLSNVWELNSYDIMKASLKSWDNDGLVALLNIPPNISSNKKIMSAIKDQMSLSQSNFEVRVNSLKSIMEMIAPQIEMSWDDFLEQSAQGVTEKEVFLQIPLKTLSVITKNIDEIKNQTLIMKRLKKLEFIKMLKSIADQPDEFADIFPMIHQALENIKNTGETIEELTKTPDSEERLAFAKTLFNDAKSQMNDIQSMYDVELIHDNLTRINRLFLKDAIQSLKQNKFNDMENSPKVEKSLGYNLYFPKFRGDLHYLGEENGWCVSTSSYYGDNIIKKGNILLGICAPGKPSAKENVIVLCHFLKEDDGYVLEQIKWSSKEKDGERNVDAINDFNYNKILAEIQKHLSHMEKKEGAK